MGKSKFEGIPLDYQHAEAESLYHIIDTIKQSFDVDHELWFRGQASYDYKLIPYSLRNPLYDEYSANYEFQLQFPEEKIKCETMFDWLTVLQHYGIPTRLLDWSTNLFIGLFFACYSKVEEVDLDASLFVYDPLYDGNGYYETDNQEVELISQLTNMTSIENFDLNTDAKKALNNAELKYSIIDEKIYLLDIRNNDQDMSFIFENILPVKPRKNFNQITAQYSVFTIHGGKLLNEKEVIPIKPLKSYHNDKLYRILKIKISNHLKNDILSDLKQFGISERTLFLDIINQAKYIKNKYYKL